MALRWFWFSLLFCTTLFCTKFQADVDKTHSAELAIEGQISEDRLSHVTQRRRWLFSFQMPNSPLTYHHTWHVYLRSPLPQSFGFVIYTYIYFFCSVLCMGVTESKASEMHFLFQKWSISSLRNRWAPNISKLIADVFLSIKLKKKPNSYSVLLLMFFML